MKYDYLIGNETSKNIIVTEDLLNKAVNNLVSKRRNKEEAFTESDEEIIDLFITEQDVLTSINSAANLQAKKADTSVKFDDVRKMPLSLDALEGYEDAEKLFIQHRLDELSKDFVLEKTTDKFLAWRVALCELKIMQLETLMVVNKKEATSIDAGKQIDLLDKQYKAFCESLNVLKRQRDNTKKQSDNKSAISDTLNELDKSIEDLKHDVELEEQEELKMLKKRKK